MYLPNFRLGPSMLETIWNVDLICICQLDLLWLLYMQPVPRHKHAKCNWDDGNQASTPPVSMNWGTNLGPTMPVGTTGISTLPSQEQQTTYSYCSGLVHWWRIMRMSFRSRTTCYLQLESEFDKHGMWRAAIQFLWGTACRREGRWDSGRQREGASHIKRLALATEAGHSTSERCWIQVWAVTSSDEQWERRNWGDRAIFS